MLSSFLLMALATPLASPVIDHAAIDAAIATYTGAPIGTPGGAVSPLDRRLRMAACRDVRINWRTARHDTLVLECPTGAGWRLFVPIAQARTAPTPVATVAAPIPEAEPLVIAKGDVVTVEIKGGGFTVSQTGQAMEAGPIGSWIKVKMTGKGEIVMAQVIRRGLANLPAA